MNSLVLHSSIVLYYITVWIGLLPLVVKTQKGDEDERVTIMRSIGARYLTIWNLAFQTTAFFGYFVCDILEAQQKYSSFRKILKRFADAIFYSIVGPVSVMVVFLFWTIYSFDRGLVFIYPTLIGDVLTPWSNHTMHTNILPLVLLQAYHNKSSRVEYSTTKKILMTLTVLYTLCLYGTYFQKNVWVYPVLNYFFEPLRLMFLAFVIGVILGVNAVFYRLNEWYCNSSFGSPKESVQHKKKSH